MFTIHGNHDDPSSADDTSAVDILASANLLNYFGKSKITRSDANSAGEVKIRPILIRKGNVKLALYGLGNIRDERMCRLFSSPKGVEWARPASSAIADIDDWVNLFILHQNRVAHVQGAKNIVKESHLPKFLDVVVWGHEHECISKPWVRRLVYLAMFWCFIYSFSSLYYLQSSLMSGEAFSVLQPGSSVATALSEGESKRKHVFVLEIVEGKWRTIEIPLETVRPLAFDSVVLASQPSVNPGNPDTVQEFLTKKVEEMIEKAKLERGNESPELPLIRLRVDYSGFSTINTQVFAHQFVNKVANPQDIVLWQKPPKRVIRKTASSKKETTLMVGEKNMETLIGEHLHETLKLLPAIELTHALNEYVQKDERMALADTVKKVLTETTKEAKKATQCKDVDSIQNEQHKELIAEAIESAAGRRKNRIEADELVKRAKESLEKMETDLGENNAAPQEISMQENNDIEIQEEEEPEMIDLCAPDSSEKTKTKRSRASDESKTTYEPSSSGRKAPKSVQNTTSDSMVPSGSRVSTRARALADLRATRTGSQATETKWGSLRK